MSDRQTRKSDFVVTDEFPCNMVNRDGRFTQLDEADSLYPGSLVYCQNLHYLELANENKNVTAIITTPNLAAEQISDSKALIISDDPRFTFFSLYTDLHANGFNRPDMEFGIGKDCRIHPSAIVSEKVKIGHRVEIGAGAVVEDYSHLKDDVIVGPNAVIGAEGLITVRRKDNSLLTIKHTGGVLIGNGVEILAGAVIAKSLFHHPTTIGDHCQIGIMANVGHSVSIGELSVISGNSVIAGRTKLGRKVWMGASASVAQGLVVGDEAQIKMGSVVVTDIASKAVVSGNFAVSHKANIRHHLRLKHNEKI